FNTPPHTYIYTLSLHDALPISFDELGMYRYIKLMYKKNVSENYRNEKIVKIMKKDAENNSELLKTLWYYIKNNCRVGKTAEMLLDRKSTRLNSSHVKISYAVFC